MRKRKNQFLLIQIYYNIMNIYEQNDKLKPLDVSDEDDSNLEQDYYSTSIKDLVGSNNLDTNNQIIPDRKLDNKNKADKEYNINCFTKELENNLLLFEYLFIKITTLLLFFTNVLLFFKNTMRA